ncbi:Putative membrane protein, partial [Candidatus Arthromitus sp. SFB-3]
MEILLIPIALALDAFGVALSLGFSNKYKFKQLMLFCL